MAAAVAARSDLLTTLAAMSAKVAPVRTSEDPDAIRLRLLQVLRAAISLAQLLSQYDLGEPLDRAAEELVGRLAEYCKHFAQGTERSLPPLLEICARFTNLLCRAYETVLVTADD